MRTFVLFRRGPAPVLFAVCGLALTCPSWLDASGQAPKTGAWPRVYIEDAFTRGAVEWALTGAAQWLANERCRGVLSEFRDTHGRPLTERLEAHGVDVTDLPHVPPLPRRRREPRLRRRSDVCSHHPARTRGVRLRPQVRAGLARQRRARTSCRHSRDAAHAWPRREPADQPRRHRAHSDALRHQTGEERVRNS